RIGYVDMATGIISTVAGNGTFTFCGDGGPATEGCLWNPISMALGADGSFYISDFWNSRDRFVSAPRRTPRTSSGTSIIFPFFAVPLLSFPCPGLLRLHHKRIGPRRFRLTGGIDLPEPGSKGEGPALQASSRDQTRGFFASFLLRCRT